MKKVATYRQKATRQKVVILIILLALLGCLWIGYSYFHKPFLPTSIKSQIDFKAYYPVGLTDWKVDKSSIKFKQDGEIKLVTYVLYGSNPKVTITEQAVPGILTESVGYNFVVGKMNQYDQINSQNGPVALTRPKELNGSQAAVCRIGDTLIYAQPSKDLKNSQWQTIFNSLEAVR